MLWVVNGEKVQSVNTDFQALNSPSLVIKMSPFLLVQGRHLSRGRFTPAFRKEGPGRERGSDLCFCCFLKLLQLKIFNMPRCLILG